MRLWRLTSVNERQTAALGEALGALLRAGDVIGLDGPLGAGKTTLTRAIARGMGLDVRQVSSPTFTLVHEYTRPSPQAPGRTGPGLAHVDAYRLSGADELDSVDWQRLLDPASGLAIAIEWAARIEDQLPPQDRTARIQIEPEDEHHRGIEALLPRSWADRPAATSFKALAGKPLDATPCPITGQLVPTDSPTWPFASEQARMADLHRWFAGEYRLSREATEEDLER